MRLTPATDGDMRLLENTILTHGAAHPTHVIRGLPTNAALSMHAIAGAQSTNTFPGPRYLGAPLASDRSARSLFGNAPNHAALRS
jgi:hypothetical protein